MVVLTTERVVKLYDGVFYYQGEREGHAGQL
jgi:hypothetical protein